MANNATFEAIFSLLETAAQNEGALSKPLCKVIASSKESILAEYDAVRKEAKADFMEDKNGLLDRHKCAAALIIAILKGLRADELEAHPLVSRVIRERIAILSGLTLLANMIKGDDGNPQNKRILEYWNRNGKTIRYPETMNGSGKYTNNWAVELYFARQKDRLFILALAHELFLLEVYNRMLVDMEATQAK